MTQPMVLVVNGVTGEEAYLTECYNVGFCGSEPFLSDAGFTPSVRDSENTRRALCRVCAERLHARLRNEGRPVPEIDWYRAYPTWERIATE